MWLLCAIAVHCLLITYVYCLVPWTYAVQPWAFATYFLHMFATIDAFMDVRPARAFTYFGTAQMCSACIVVQTYTLAWYWASTSALGALVACAYYRATQRAESSTPTTSNATPMEANTLCAAEEVCPICLDDMQAAHMLACKHVFHAHCLQVWLSQSTRCPVCNASVDVPAVV